MKVEISNERFKSIEILFNPKLIDLENDGIAETLYNSIGNCDFELRNELFNNICLSGGNTMFDGLSERVKNELSNFVNPSKKIITPPERKYSDWIGGSIISSLSDFQNVFLFFLIF
jgi:actin, other eukaryote